MAFGFHRHCFRMVPNRWHRQPGRHLRVPPECRRPPYALSGTSYSRPAPAVSNKVFCRQPPGARVEPQDVKGTVFHVDEQPIKTNKRQNLGSFRGRDADNRADARPLVLQSLTKQILHMHSCDALLAFPACGSAWSTGPRAVRRCRKIDRGEEKVDLPLCHRRKFHAEHTVGRAEQINIDV